jgi:2-oxoglutarate dehydrogenase E2 component (dihydrolipoamide succinyltransferase)
MGESVTEGTIVRWIKKVGDAVARDEPLFEISTDKVDAEIPSPAAGILTEIKIKEGETVLVDAVVGTIGQAGEDSAPSPQPQADGAPASAVPASAVPATARQASSARQAATAKQAPASSANRVRESPPAPEAQDPANGNRSGGSNGPQTGEDSPRQKSSPLVRRIAKEHNVDVSQIHGSGMGGRVTKTDILGYLDGGLPEPRSKEPAARIQESGTRVEPMSVVRKKIAEHMILSRRTSAHVHTVFHVNFSTIDRIRHQKKLEYERRGAKLTYMAFIAKAAIDALRRHPIVNSSIDGDNVIYHQEINLGIAVALEAGLIVPVVKRADERNMLGLSRAIADVAERARAKQLKPDEVHGGTFTITNPGQFGAQFGMPIINQPQVGILCVGTVEKRPVVVDDALAIRPMAYLTLGFDHRLVDGAVADQFMADIKHQIEHFDASQV